MSPLEVGIRLVAGVLLILSNRFFVAIEFALTRARQFSEEEFVGDAHGALERAWEMTQDLEIYLTTCPVGISGGRTSRVTWDEATARMTGWSRWISREAIAECRVDQDVDLIVMGSSGRSRIKENLLESTVVRVVQSVDNSVLLGRSR